MKNNKWLPIAIAVVSLGLSSCGLSQNSSTQNEASNGASSQKTPCPVGNFNEDILTEDGSKYRIFSFVFEADTLTFTGHFSLKRKLCDFCLNFYGLEKKYVCNLLAPNELSMFSMGFDGDISFSFLVPSTLIEERKNFPEQVCFAWSDFSLGPKVGSSLTDDSDFSSLYFYTVIGNKEVRGFEDQFFQ